MPSTALIFANRRRPMIWPLAGLLGGLVTEVIVLFYHIAFVCRSSDILLARFSDMKTDRNFKGRVGRANRRSHDRCVDSNRFPILVGSFSFGR